MRSTDRRNWRRALVFLWAVFALTGEDIGSARGADFEKVVAAIRAEAGKHSSDPAGKPLPLAGHWNSGLENTGFGPKEQRQMIQAGHHLLPWFAQPQPDGKELDEDYYLETLRWCAEHKLPITLICTQWERLLSFDKRFYNLPADDNPNVVDSTGKAHRSVSPFGPLAPWQQVGQIWAQTDELEKLQQLYPDPPLVLFLSNNEHTKLRWQEIDKDRRFAQKHGTNVDDDGRRAILGDGWIERYRAMHASFQQSLSQPAWREHARFAGYNAFGPWFIGRWPGWTGYSLHVPGRISPWPSVWGGGSVPYYTNSWEVITDYFLYSPQIQAMNWVPMLDEALSVNPDFWFEVSTWDGQVPGDKNDKKAFYESKDQTYTPQRYAGMVQYGMWLLRPRVVREFRGYRETYETFGEYFDEVVAAVDRVHNDPMLAEFWRKGKLVANARQGHPYQTLLPADFSKQDRWYMLETSVDPKQPWGLYTNIPVYSLALVRGNRPNREWLIFAHAPLGEQRNVEFKIPGYRHPVRSDVAVEGTFIHVQERR